MIRRSPEIFARKTIRAQLLPSSSCQDLPAWPGSGSSAARLQALASDDLLGLDMIRRSPEIFARKTIRAPRAQLVPSSRFADLPAWPGSGSSAARLQALVHGDLLDLDMIRRSPEIFTRKTHRAQLLPSSSLPAWPGSGSSAARLQALVCDDLLDLDMIRRSPEIFARKTIRAQLLLASSFLDSSAWWGSGNTAKITEI